MNPKFAIAWSATALLAVAGLATSTSFAADQDKPSGTVSASETHTATVTKIDTQNRWVTLKMADGSTFDVQAGSEVKNFAQIKVGDKVTFTQKDTVSIDVVPAGQAAPNVTGGSAMVTAPLGAKPMATKVDTTVVSGSVTAIDYAKRLVTVQGPEGNSHTLAVGKGAKKFKAVKVGDVIVLTLKSATTIEVVSPGK
jgi:ribosomal 50S subunit-recycling heat shock protein